VVTLLHWRDDRLVGFVLNIPSERKFFAIRVRSTSASLGLFNMRMHQLAGEFDIYYLDRTGNLDSAFRTVSIAFELDLRPVPECDLVILNAISLVCWTTL
jgi:hypothetical protein